MPDRDPWPVTEPVDKRLQKLYVEACIDLHWLMEHGRLQSAAEVLAEIRQTEQGADFDRYTE